MAREPWVWRHATIPKANAGEVAEQATTIQAVRAQPLGDREHDLPVRDGGQERRVQPLLPEGQPEEVLVRAAIAPDAGATVIEDATREELVGDLAHDRPPRPVRRRETLVVHHLEPVPVILHQPEERRGLRSARLVDAEGPARQRSMRRVFGRNTTHENQK